jgi:hypothetical protein
VGDDQETGHQEGGAADLVGLRGRVEPGQDLRFVDADRGVYQGPECFGVGDRGWRVDCGEAWRIAGQNQGVQGACEAKGERVVQGVGISVPVEDPAADRGRAAQALAQHLAEAGGEGRAQLHAPLHLAGEGRADFGFRGHWS